MKTKLYMCRRPRSNLCILFGWWFSLCEPLWAQVSWPCRSSCGILDHSGSHFPFPILPQDTPGSAYCLAVSLCICSHKLLGKASLMKTGLGTGLMSIAGYHCESYCCYVLFRTSVWFCHWMLDYLVSDSWPL